jgi:PAS domain S-box-containing protein
MENSQIKILAIDDNKDNLVVLEALVNDLFPDTKFLSAESGKKGIDLCQTERPDVILLDIVMPEMDGYEVCLKLKSNERLRQIPVIMVTTNRNDSQSRIKALDSGADAFLSKPVEVSELKAQISAMLRIKKSEDIKRAEREKLEDTVLDRTEALEIELADRKKAEKKLIQSLDKLTRNRQAILNLMEDLKTEMDEKRKVEASLKTERNLLRTLVDNLPDTIYILDREGKKIMANKADLKNIGSGEESEVIGKTDLDLFPMEIGKRGHADNLSVINTEIPIIDREEYFIDKSGTKRWLLTSKYPLYDGSGKISGLFGTGHDITERKIFAEELAMKNNELQFLNKIAIELSQLSSSEDLNKLLPRQLMEFSGAVFAAFSEYNAEKKVLVTKHVESAQTILNQLIKLIGKKVIGLESPVSDENYSVIIKEIAGIRKTVTEVTFGAIPEKADKALKMFTGVDRFYALAYVVGDELFGTTMLGFKTGTSAPRIELLAAFAHMAALSLQRRKAEEKLRESEERYRLLIENQGEGVGIVDLKEKFVFANRAAEEMFGLGHGDLLNRNLMDFVKGDQLQILINENKKRSKADKSSYEINITRLDGELRTLLITATPQFSKDGKLTGTFGVFRDISERKQLEEKIIESEAYFRTLIDISPDGILTTDTEGNVTYGSLKSLEIFGVPSGMNVIGSSILNWISPDYTTMVLERFSEILSGNIVPETKEYKLNKYDKSVFWGELSSSPLPSKDGVFTGLLIVCRDISNRKKAEEDLIKARDKAEESDRLKTAFLHNISHEIRTPMNAITGFSALLHEPDLDTETQHSFIDIINQSSNHLLTIVTDIIEISNIEAGLLKFNKKEINLNSLLMKLINEFNPRATDKGIEFRYEIGLDNNQSVIQMDSDKLNQILLNLLNNAFKFTENGLIKFGYKQKNGFLEFYVSDTGIGVPHDHQKRIFERFYQVESTLARQYEGTGLGLPISKAYVELMGGTIWLESEQGSGSVFYFTIPYIQSGGNETLKSYIPETQKIISNGKKTILIAEDEENNYLLLLEFLSSLNVELLHANNGKEAVEICESEKVISLVLMDIKMPVMDGYAATREIRKNYPGLPVVALTAYSFEDDRKKAFACGCNDFISKPFSKNAILETVTKYLYDEKA